MIHLGSTFLVELRERQAAQSHFADLCQLVEHATPTDADHSGEFFCSAG